MRSGSGERRIEGSPQRRTDVKAELNYLPHQKVESLPIPCCPDSDIFLIVDLSMLPESPVSPEASTSTTVAQPPVPPREVLSSWDEGADATSTSDWADMFLRQPHRSLRGISSFVLGIPLAIAGSFFLTHFAASYRAGRPSSHLITNAVTTTTTTTATNRHNPPPRTTTRPTTPSSSPTASVTTVTTVPTPSVLPSSASPPPSPPPPITPWRSPSSATPTPGPGGDEPAWRSRRYDMGGPGSLRGLHDPTGTTSRVGTNLDLDAEDEPVPVDRFSVGSTRPGAWTRWDSASASVEVDEDGDAHHSPLGKSLTVQRMQRSAERAIESADRAAEAAESAAGAALRAVSLAAEAAKVRVSYTTQRQRTVDLSLSLSLCVCVCVCNVYRAASVKTSTRTHCHPTPLLPLLCPHPVPLSFVLLPSSFLPPPSSRRRRTGRPPRGARRGRSWPCRRTRWWNPSG